MASSSWIQRSQEWEQSAYASRIHEINVFSRTSQVIKSKWPTNYFPKMAWGALVLRSHSLTDMHPCPASYRRHQHCVDQT